MSRYSIKKSIVFTGMMGSGKSTIGKMVAKKLSMQFYDSDKVVEEREGLSLVDIYDFKGEEYFKKKEEDVVKEVLEYGVVVLSTGGGTFLNGELRRLIKERSLSIWLRADLGVLYSRVSRKNTRPELNAGNKLEILRDMMDKCYPIYEQADIIVDSKDFAAHYIVDTVMNRIKKFFA